MLHSAKFDIIITLISEYNLPLVWTNSRTVPTATAVIQMMLTGEMTWLFYRVVLCCVVLLLYLVFLLLQSGNQSWPFRHHMWKGIHRK